jgi:hypothetical protein
LNETTRVLVVGAGRRVQNNFLPALQYLRPDFECVGIHSRTPDRLLPVAERWKVPAIFNLQDVDFTDVQAVAISVPTAQNAPVLEKVAQLAPHVSIVIDTPVVWGRREVGACARELRRFPKVLVTEDYMNFPSFTLLRRAVSEGLIGTLQATTLNNIGYYYHGLALIRSFSGFSKATRTWKGGVGGLSTVTGYKFPGGYQACVIGPYRQHAVGGIMLEGSRGILSDYPSDLKFSKPDRPVYILNRIESEGATVGFTIAGTEDRYTVDLPEMNAMRSMPLDDTSDLNLERGWGLMQVFRALRDPSNFNNSYGPKNAFYDSFVSRLAERGVFRFDPLTLVGSDTLTAATSLLAR